MRIATYRHNKTYITPTLSSPRPSELQKSPSFKSPNPNTPATNGLEIIGTEFSPRKLANSNHDINKPNFAEPTSPKVKAQM